MKYYQATINLAGNNNNQVHKPCLAAPEVMLLREIHGIDAVNGVDEARPENIDKDLKRLTNAGVRAKMTNHYGVKAVTSMFGKFGPLPDALGDDQLGDGIVPLEEAETNEISMLNGANDADLKRDEDVVLLGEDEDPAAETPPPAPKPKDPIAAMQAGRARAQAARAAAKAKQELVA